MKTIIIIGDSPTLKELEEAGYIKKLLDKFDSISINRTTRKCTYTIGIDDACWYGVQDRILRGEIPADFSKWVAPFKMKDLNIPFYMLFKHDEDINADNDGMFYFGFNSLTPALNLAYVEGAARVVIVACELQFGTAHTSNPNQIFAPKDWERKSTNIQKIVGEYKKKMEIVQIAKPEHLLDVPVVTPEYVLENY